MWGGCQGNIMIRNKMVITIIRMLIKSKIKLINMVNRIIII